MLGNWIKQATTTSGTGNLTLSSVTGFDTFGSQFGDATTNTPARYFPYVVKDGNNWESGIGHMSTTTVLVRDIVTAKFVSGIFSAFPATKLSLSGSAADVFSDIHSDLQAEDYYGVWLATSNGVPFRRIGRQEATTGCFTGWTQTWPVFLPRSGIYTGIRQHCTAAGGGTKWQWGLYAIGNDGIPSDLIVRTGDITPATGDSTVSWNGGNKYLQRGWYAMSWSSPDSSPSFTGSNDYGGYDLTPCGASSAGLASSGWQQNVGNNPLPATHPSSPSPSSQVVPSNQLVSA